MGTTSFVSPWVDKPEYIINLTKNIVGEHSLKKLVGKTDNSRRSIRTMLFLFAPRIVIELAKVSDETLGRIAAYGTEGGFHHGPPAPAPFLNLTGYRDLLVDEYDFRSGSGRDHLVQLALLAIVCVAHDIVRQNEHQAEIAAELEENETFERSAENHIHGRKRK